MQCPAENCRKKKNCRRQIFFLEITAWLKLDLIFKAGKNYNTYRNHLKLPVFSYFKKNCGLNRRILIYLASRFGKEEDFLPDFKEIIVIRPIHQILNRSGIYFIAFFKIAALYSFSFFTSTPLSFLAQILQIQL